MDELKYTITLESCDGDIITRTVAWDETWMELAGVFLQMLRGMGYQIACCAEDKITSSLEAFQDLDRERRNAGKE
jgi:hypothetical protein